MFFKVFHSILFSSEILSITIEDKYYVIDSIEEFNKVSDLVPIFFIPGSLKSDLEVYYLQVLEKFELNFNFIYFNFRMIMNLKA